MSFKFLGYCAYFNSYEDGNIDGRPCIGTANLFCPNVQYSSADNTKCKLMSTVISRSPEPKAQVSFSYQDLSVVWR